jgi:hypothetical protein
VLMIDAIDHRHSSVVGTEPQQPAQIGVSFRRSTDVSRRVYTVLFFEPVQGILIERTL